jgi:hypothetical protein
MLPQFTQSLNNKHMTKDDARYQENDRSKFRGHAFPTAKNLRVILSIKSGDICRTDPYRPSENEQTNCIVGELSRSR